MNFVDFTFDVIGLYFLAVIEWLLMIVIISLVLFGLYKGVQAICKKIRGI